MVDHATHDTEPVLLARRLGIDTYQQPIVYMRLDCHVCADRRASPRTLGRRAWLFGALALESRRGWRGIRRHGGRSGTDTTRSWRMGGVRLGGGHRFRGATCGCSHLGCVGTRLNAG